MTDISDDEYEEEKNNGNFRADAKLIFHVLEYSDASRLNSLQCPRCLRKFITRKGRRRLRRHMDNDRCETRVSENYSISSDLYSHSSSSLSTPSISDLGLDYTTTSAANDFTTGISERVDDYCTSTVSSTEPMNSNDELKDSLNLDELDYITIPDFDNQDYDLYLQDC